jgi:hypothetical protein
MDSRKALVNEIVNELKKGINVAMIAPTGWGKTHLAFKVAIELGKEGYRVGVKFPTLTVAVKKWQELVSLLQNADPRPSAILTAGAQQFCIYKWQYPQRYCNRCPLRRQQQISVPQKVAYYELDKLVPDDACAYWVQEELFPNFNIIIGHYGRAVKTAPHVHFMIWDEAQEAFIPNIKSMPLYEIAEVLRADVSELTDVNTIKEYAEARLVDADPVREDVLFSLLQMMKKTTCWIEDQVLNCLDMRSMPSGIPTLALTATPPPGWPPEGWGRKIEIKPPAKPRAFVEPEARFYYKDGYRGIALQLYLIIQWLKKKFGVKCVIIFAISSVRHVLEYSLPFEISHEPPEKEQQIPPSGVVVVDAWGRMRVGVDIRYCDAAVLPWPSLNIAARRRLRAEGKNPDMAELLLSVQLAGRIMRPRLGESYEDVLNKRIVVLADARFWSHVDYLAQFFTIEELPADLQVS